MPNLRQVKDGKTTTTYISDKEPTLKELQSLVGGYIELVYDDGKTQIICNEEGKLNGSHYNSGATSLWHSLLRQDAFYEIPDHIVGDVVVLTKKALMT